MFSRRRESETKRMGKREATKKEMQKSGEGCI